jgi:signal transduction histidine kinase
MLTDAIRRLHRIPQVFIDGGIALVLMVSAAVAAYQDTGALSPLQALLIALITLPVAARSRFPTVVSAFIGTALIVNVTIGFTNSFIENFAILLALYTMYANARADIRLTIMSGVVVVGVVAGVALGWRNEHRVYLYDIGYNAIIFAMPAILGFGVRTRRAYIAEVRERSKLLAREAVAEERTAIARELHDVIAHSVSVMVLQATAGKRVALRDPSGAAAAFGVIEQTGRQAMTDLRHVVGVLKVEATGNPTLAPQPSLMQLDSLVDQVRHTGVGVQVAIEGTQRSLSPGVELSAYRIVQESLTNVMKHSGATDAFVAITYGPEDLTIEIRDNGHNGTALSSGGSGLEGMRQRVALLHGDFHAESLGDGFRVQARIPLEPPTA